MKKLIIILLILIPLLPKAQDLDTALVSTKRLTFATGTLIADSSFFLKDSCWTVKHIDTIQVDFLITVNSNNFIKKERADYIIHKYETKVCRYTQYGFYPTPKENEVFLLNGKPIEVLLYKLRGDFNSLMVGNSK